MEYRTNPWMEEEREKKKGGIKDILQNKLIEVDHTVTRQLLCSLLFMLIKNPLFPVKEGYSSCCCCFVVLMITC